MIVNDSPSREEAHAPNEYPFARVVFARGNPLITILFAEMAELTVKRTDPITIRPNFMQFWSVIVIFVLPSSVKLSGTPLSTFPVAMLFSALAD
jgi:hypothetical protein